MNRQLLNGLFSFIHCCFLKSWLSLFTLGRSPFTTFFNLLIPVCFSISAVGGRRGSKDSIPIRLPTLVCKVLTLCFWEWSHFVVEIFLKSEKNRRASTKIGIID